MASPVEKVSIHLGKLYENIKANYYDEAVKNADICSLIKDNFPIDCILTAEKKDFAAHKIVLEAVSSYLKVIFKEFVILWL